MNFKQVLWNPLAFFISLMMSIIMPLIFAVPSGMPLEICFLYWPFRWVVAYFIVTLFVNKIAFKLAKEIFDFKPGL